MKNATAAGPQKKVLRDDVRLPVPLGLFLCVSSRNVGRGKATPIHVYLAIEDRWGSGKKKDGTPKERECWERTDRIAKRCSLATSTTALQIDLLVDWGFVVRSYFLNGPDEIRQERHSTEEQAAARQEEIKTLEGTTYNLHRMLTPPARLPRLSELAARKLIRPELLRTKQKAACDQGLRPAGAVDSARPERVPPTEQVGEPRHTEEEVVAGPDTNDTQLTYSKLTPSPLSTEEEDSPSSSVDHTNEISRAAQTGQKRAAIVALSAEEFGRAEAMAAALDQAHRSRCNGLPLVIKPGDPEWSHIVAASKQAFAAKILPKDWIAAIISALRSFSKSVNPFPNASQLHGGKAASYVGNFIATTGPEAQSVRRAIANAEVPLIEDHDYQRCRERMKRNIHNLADVAYVRTRQIKMFGAEKPWLRETEEKALARLAAPSTRTKMNGQHPAGVS